MTAHSPMTEEGLQKCLGGSNCQPANASPKLTPAQNTPTSARLHFQPALHNVYVADLDEVSCAADEDELDDAFRSAFSDGYFSRFRSDAQELHNPRDEPNMDERQSKATERKWRGSNTGENIAERGTLFSKVLWDKVTALDPKRRRAMSSDRDDSHSALFHISSKMFSLVRSIVSIAVSVSRHLKNLSAASSRIVAKVAGERKKPKCRADAVRGWKFEIRS